MRIYSSTKHKNKIKTKLKLETSQTKQTKNVRNKEFTFTIH